MGKLGIAEILLIVGVLALLFLPAIIVLIMFTRNNKK